MSDDEHTEKPQEEVPAPELKVKKENSYTYWVKNDPNYYGEKKPEYLAPKKIDETEAKKLREYNPPHPYHSLRLEEAKKNGASAWNTSGTW